MNEQKYPKNDDDMIYDFAAHRYVLTEQCVLRELGEDLKTVLNATGDANPSTLASRFLSRVSQVVYSTLYRNSQGEAFLEYILATYPPLRQRVKDMLLAQTMYMLMNGDLGLMSGVNVAKGQAMELYQLRGRVRLAPEVEDISNTEIPGMGFCLSFRGALPCVPCGEYRRGY